MSREKTEIVNDITKLVQELVSFTEPVTSVWDLKGKEECWVITGKGSIMRYKADLRPFESRRAVGNVFLTKDAAIKELEVRIRTARTNNQGLCS